MSWFDTTKGFASLAKSALKEAQKKIDKVLDIQEDELISGETIKNTIQSITTATDETLLEDYSLTKNRSDIFLQPEPKDPPMITTPPKAGELSKELAAATALLADNTPDRVINSYSVEDSLNNEEVSLKLIKEKESKLEETMLETNLKLATVPEIQDVHTLGSSDDGSEMLDANQNEITSSVTESIVIIGSCSSDTGAETLGEQEQQDYDDRIFTASVIKTKHSKLSRENSNESHMAEVETTETDEDEEEKTGKSTIKRI